MQVEAFWVQMGLGWGSDGSWDALGHKDEGTSLQDHQLGRHCVQLRPFWVQPGLSLGDPREALGDPLSRPLGS